MTSSPTLSPPGLVALKGPCTVAEAEANHRLLRAALAAPGDVRLDCGAVTAADITLVQLVLAARRSAAAAGRSLRLAGPAAGPLRQVLLAAGFAGPDGAWADSFWLGE